TASGKPNAGTNPRRTLVSMRLMPAAFTSTTTSSRFGFGTGRSSTRSTSAGPYSDAVMTRTVCSFSYLVPTVREGYSPVPHGLVIRRVVRAEIRFLFRDAYAVAGALRPVGPRRRHRIGEIRDHLF